MLARATRCTLAIAALVLHPAAAQELPAELLLHCEGTMNAVLEAQPSPVTRTQTFSVNLHLKDGTIADTGSGIVEGTGCAIENDFIKCEVTKQYPMPQFNAVVKRSSSVALHRKNGEITLLLESWDYPQNSDTHTGHMRVMRTGICRSDAMF
jgi:hypothetical protein